MASSERQGLTWVGVRSEEAWARGDVGRREGGTRRARLVGPSTNDSLPTRRILVSGQALLGHLPGRDDCTVPG